MATIFPNLIRFPGACPLVIVAHQPIRVKGPPKVSIWQLLDPTHKTPPPAVVNCCVAYPRSPPLLNLTPNLSDAYYQLIHSFDTVYRIHPIHLQMEQLLDPNALLGFADPPDPLVIHRDWDGWPWDIPPDPPPLMEGGSSSFFTSMTSSQSIQGGFTPLVRLLIELHRSLHFSPQSVTGLCSSSLALGTQTHFSATHRIAGVVVTVGVTTTPAIRCVALG